MRIALATLLLAVVASAEVLHFTDYSVYRLRPNNTLQLGLLQKLQDTENIDFWREPDQVNRIADIMLSPENKEKLLKYFTENGIQFELMVPDVEQRIESERKEQKIAEELLESRQWPGWNQGDEAIAGFWTRYQRFNQHTAFVDALASKNPSLVQKITFGRSYEGRTLIAAKIGANSNSQKPVIWMQGGIHAREWISPATVTYFAQQLVNKYNAGDSEVKDLLNYFDFYIVPVLNADGYEYTHTTNRMWRKTRKPSGWGCVGTDPNRNYGYSWGGVGASSNPCTETFRGQRAFSEPETKAESDYILNQLRGRVKAFIAAHAYGQYWLYPWGYTSQLTPDNNEVNRVARIAVGALNQVSPSTRFTIGTATNVLYAAAGGADDWAYGAAKVKYSYTVELRDTGAYGFQLPASYIVPTGKEVTAAWLALAKEVKAASRG